jgi:lysophospholipase L1-like esterase
MKNKVVLLFVTFCIVGGSLLPIQPEAAAETKMTDWISSTDLQHEYLPEHSDELCSNEMWSIERLAGFTYADPKESDEHEVCVYRGKNFVYAYYHRTYGGPVYYNESGLAVAIGSDIAERVLKPIDNTRDLLLDASPDSDVALMITGFVSYKGHYMYPIRHFIDHLTYDDHNHRYILSDITPLSYGGALVQEIGYGLSRNGRWLLVAAGDKDAMYRVDLNDNSMQLVGMKRFVSDALAGPTVNGFISNDGEYGGFAGVYTSFFIVHMTESCLSQALTYTYDIGKPASGIVFSSPCEWRDIYEFTDQFTDSNPTTRRDYTNLSMSPDGESITYRDNSGWNYISYEPRPIIQYLSLGDSYASGEGDITADGLDHYFAGTNIYGNYSQNTARETCHLSTRSYSMRIAAAMQLMKGVDMQSVACAGAVTADILSASKQSNGYVDSHYLGQSTQLISTVGPRLSGISNATTLQNQARQDYTPGRVQQIEFVKKAQPQYVTVMVGGNDLDFGGMLATCAKNALPSADETCDYAETTGMAGVVKKIHDLYPTLLRFYGALHEASPKTTIYVIGYPQFIDETSETCKEMLDLYSKPERKAFHQMIDYANAVIKNAALDTGAKYIDISDALTGGQLCDTGTDMTGMSDVFAVSIYTEYMKTLTMSDSNIAKYLNIFPTGLLHDIALKLYLTERTADVASRVAYSPATAIADIMQELSHPNALGHEAMYDAIKRGLGEDLLESDVCNNVVVCPGNTQHGQPDVSKYVAGFALDADDDTVYVGVGGKVTFWRKSSLGDGIYGALVKGESEQFVRVSSTDIPELVDDTQSIVVELHSRPIVLGTMTRVGDMYELKTSLLPSVAVGQHVLHIKGKLIDGRAFDLDTPVFVEGPVGDIDDDSIADATDTCAFDKASSIDRDRDGIDDVCDLAVSVQDGAANDRGLNADAGGGSSGQFDQVASDAHTSLSGSSVGANAVILGVDSGTRPQIITDNSPSTSGLWVWPMLLVAGIFGGLLAIVAIISRVIRIKQ